MFLDSRLEPYKLEKFQSCKPRKIKINYDRLTCFFWLTKNKQIMKQTTFSSSSLCFSFKVTLDRIVTKNDEE